MQCNRVFLAAISRELQITVFCAPQRMDAEFPIVAHNGGSARAYLADLSRHQRSGHHGRPRHYSERALEIYAGCRVAATRAHAAE